jgi:hypothetical protein
MRVITHQGDQAALAFLFPPGATPNARRVVREVAEDARKALVAQYKADVPDVQGWMRDEYAALSYALGAGPEAQIEATVEKLADDNGQDRLDAILQDLAVAISGAIGAPCEVSWK